MGFVPQDKEIIKKLKEIVKSRVENDQEDAETILTDLLAQGFEEKHIKEAFKQLKML